MLHINKIIKKYLNRTMMKSMDITPQIIQSLENLILEYGQEVFNRNKSPLSSRTIQSTIPLMLNNKIIDIVENLKSIKTIRRNSLDHYKLIYGNNAEKVYGARTKKSINTLENFISRYGTIDGQIKYNNLIIKKKKQNTLMGFIERFGEAGSERWKAHKDRCAYTNTLDYYVEKYGIANGYELYQERYPEVDTRSYRSYKQAVYRESERTYQKYKTDINPNNYVRTLCGIDNGWQLDHIKTVRTCFDENINIIEASHRNNLQMLPWRDNLKRNKK